MGFATGEEYAVRTAHEVKSWGGGGVSENSDKMGCNVLQETPRSKYLEREADFSKIRRNTLIGVRVETCLRYL